MSDDNQSIDLTQVAEVKREQEAKRRHRHFQVRLDEQLATQLQHYADAHHGGVRNAALKIILSKFFNGK